MKVYIKGSPIMHDGMMVNDKPVARCAIHTARDRADWQIGPANLTVNCQHCLTLRKFTADVEADE